MLTRLLKAVITKGRLTVIDPEGRAHHIGADDGSEPIIMRIRDRRTWLRLSLNPYAYAGEAYMDGGLIIEQGTLTDWMALCYENFETAASRSASSAARAPVPCAGPSA